MSLGHQGPTRRDIPDPGLGLSPGLPPKHLMQGAFSCRFKEGMAGKPRDLGRDVLGSEKLYARKLWADLPFLN